MVRGVPVIELMVLAATWWLLGSVFRTKTKFYHDNKDN